MNLRPVAARSIRQRCRPAPVPFLRGPVFWPALLLALVIGLPARAAPAASRQIPFHVENTVAVAHSGWFVQGGIPLPQGAVAGDASFRVRDDRGHVLPAQVNRTAWWPDGSLKWVLVLLRAPLRAAGRTPLVLEVVTGAGAAPPEPGRIRAVQTEREIRVETGVIAFAVPRRGDRLFSELTAVAGSGAQPLLGPGGGGVPFAEIERRTETGTARIEFAAGRGARDLTATLEEAGTERVVIRLAGTHRAANGEEFGPLALRLYAYAGSGRIHGVHTVVYNGDPERDFLRALGVRLAPRLERVTAAVLGSETGRGHRIASNFGTNRPAWKFAVLAQDDSMSYSIRKWTDPARHSAVRMEDGGRSPGWGRLEAGGIAVAAGVRNFWQESPKAIAVDLAQPEITAYFYSPYAEPLDLRRYSDFTHSELYETSASGPEPTRLQPESDWAGRIAVADLGARHIAKTSEFFLAVAAGAADADSARDALLYQEPPRLAAAPDWMASTRVWGDRAALTPEFAARHGRPLQEVTDFLVAEPAARRWYSFLDYGDLVHSYDPARDAWCRDEGGYAWNNNEHCIAEGLWSAYLHSGDVRLFRLAEAMTRHVGDVDMYHGGPLAGNGTRHNVNHYGCAAKKRRMTLPENKRLHYFLTGDEHTGDLIRFIHDSFTANTLEAEAMQDGRNTMDLAVHASALLFLWETTREARYGELLRRTTEAICAHRIRGRGIRQYVRFDPATGEVAPPLGPGLAQTKFRLDQAGKKKGPPDESAEAQTKSFLLKFGPMDLLLDTVELTGSAVVRQALLDWAELLHLPEAEAARYQGRFKAGLDCGRVAAWAYRQTGDVRYRSLLETWAANPPVWFETIGREGDPLQPPRRVPRNGEPGATGAARDRERFQLRDMADWLRNVPSMLAAIDSPAAGAPAGAGRDRVTTWRLDRAEEVGGHRTEVWGAPRAEGGALVFDGRDDGVLVPDLPLAGAGAFTIEAHFRPDEGGEPAQRFLHLQDEKNLRALLETRLDGQGRWWLDSFLGAAAPSAPGGVVLVDPARMHPTGRWYWAALRYDGTTLAHFVNGARQGEAPARFEAFGRGRTSLGVRQNRVSWFKGAIREVRFTPRALREEELQR